MTNSIKPGYTSKILLGQLIVLSGLITGIHAQDAYRVPLTEYGHPDLQGVWNYSSTTPLERPEELGDKEFLSADEIAERVAAREAAIKANTERSAGGSNNASQRGVGGYNDFWVESANLQENSRTS
ncbi:MAG: hypothetical protein WD772_13325, partial [Pseudohongiellaceae bacterium]